jgi:hypothetical protein
MLHCDTILLSYHSNRKQSVSSSFILSLFAIATAVVFFRPLLLGVAKALLLVVKPRLSREQRQARAALRAMSSR